MPHSQVWNAAFEAIPADNDQVSEGALRIRNLKRDIRERAEIDHDWDDVTDAGKHKKITFVDPLLAKPVASADEGYLYTKDVSAKAELHWEDEDGNEVQITSNAQAGKIRAAAIQQGPGSGLDADTLDGVQLANLPLSAPAGTKMLFQQTAAPTGWTKDSVHNNKALRVVTGTAGSAGATGFTSVFGAGLTTGSHTLTEAQIPSHLHSDGTLAAAFHEVAGGSAGDILSTLGNLSFGFRDSITSQGVGSIVGSTGSTGGGAGHTHTLSLDLQYVDVIIATKD